MSTKDRIEDVPVEETVEQVDGKELNEKSKAVEQAPITDFKRYEYADLYIKCSKCEKDLLFKEGIRGGLQFQLATTDKHELILECANCHNTISLHWKESENIEELRKKDIGLLKQQLDEISKKKDMIENQISEVEPKDGQSVIKEEK